VDCARFGERATARKRPYTALSCVNCGWFQVLDGSAARKTS